MGNGLAGQSVLVLGARHLGTAIAAAATAEGARVHVASHRPGGLHIDLRDEATIAAAAAELGAVDHVINTAASPHAVPIRELDRDKTVDAFTAKVLGPLLLAKHFTIRRSLLLFSGQVGWRPAAGSVVTGVTNGAAAFAARHLAVELAPVRVNALSPGIVDSGAWDAKGEAKPGFLATAAQRTLVGRTGTVADVTDAVLWLLQADFLTGETIHLEGGRR
ncbi:short-chain dehydrogenase [Actinocatenispora thailandica]|uniref:Short-chain dehydrogenase n=1 Tax=Actinocatenispora thailandica TaxID=227318 RepID=A0A7R7DV21_9ACTN|nr:SDR family oxidoreductase [Actinocatenispora thailandica]BCJ38383.1 short-chain dehydrogenase [Actinocatenispora thailandica]